VARKLLQRSTIYPYHVTARTHDREWFDLPLEVVWSYLTEEVFTAALAYGVKPHALVLMSNHFHLLISTPHENLDSAMNFLVRETSRRVNRRVQKRRHLFGDRYHWSIICGALYYAHAYKYVYTNPIRAGICERAEDYRYSTVRAVVGESKSAIPLHPPSPALGCLVPEDPDVQLDWINRPLRNRHDATLVHSALRHRIFRFSEKRIQTWHSKLLSDPL
jgi:REP element-mobilizing transposase RayT